MVFILDGCSLNYAHIVNQAFRFLEGISLPRKSRQIHFFFGKEPNLHHIRATYPELASCISTMMCHTVCPAEYQKVKKYQLNVHFF